MSLWAPGWSGQGLSPLYFSQAGFGPNSGAVRQENIRGSLPNVRKCGNFLLGGLPVIPQVRWTFSWRLSSQQSAREVLGGASSCAAPSSVLRSLNRRDRLV